MIILPAIDLYEKKAVRLLRGDYDNMTVYSDDPVQIAKDFEKSGASHIHLVDLEGAKNGLTPNISIVEQIAEATDLFIEIGGGIRSMDTIENYIKIGADRVILGTAAVEDEDFLIRAVDRYGEKIAVGLDIKDGVAAIKGWREKSSVTCYDFCAKMQSIGVKNLICTDISKDGAMEGANHRLYRELSSKYSLDITASGGVSSIDDVIKLRGIGIYGAIIGKAYYTGAISLSEAIEVAK